MNTRNLSSSLITDNEPHDQLNYEIKNREMRKIPLLETVFKNYPGVPINLDIKMDNDELIHKVYEMNFL